MYLKRVPDLQLVIIVLIFIILAWLVLIGSPHTAFADINIGGLDQSGKMDDLKNLFTTLQTVTMVWVGRVSGVLMLVIGIWRIFNNHMMQGIIAISCGAGCFILEKVANALAHVGGG